MSTRIDRIAVVRALPGVGDLLCALPALRSIRDRHPDAEVTLVGLPEAAWFAARYRDLLDDLLVVEGVPGLPEIHPDPAAAVRFYAAAQARGFDLALQVHGDGRASNPLTTMLGARHQVTAHLPGAWVPPGTSIPYPAEGPEIHRLLAVTVAAGCPPAADDVDMPLGAAEAATARRLTGDAGNGGEPGYVCLHPGASRDDNRWPAARFATVGDLVAATGLRVVLTGTIGERPVAGAVAQAMSAPVIDLCGTTSIGTLAAVFARARLVVSNDTGAAHVAAAVGTPSVVVFPAHGDPDRWAPLDRDLHARVCPEPGAGGEPAEQWPATSAVVAAALEALDRQAASEPSGPPGTPGPPGPPVARARRNGADRSGHPFAAGRPLRPPAPDAPAPPPSPRWAG